MALSFRRELLEPPVRVLAIQWTSAPSFVDIPCRAKRLNSRRHMEVISLPEGRTPTIRRRIAPPLFHVLHMFTIRFYIL